MTETFAAIARVYLAGTHLETAAFFAREAKRHELAQSGSPSRAVMRFAIGSVLSSVAFLEALINSIYVDTASGVGTKRLLFSASEQEILKRLWPLVERANVVDKYQVVIQFARHRELPRSSTTWEHVGALIALRNSLVHFKPESVTLLPEPRSQSDLSALERKLRGKFAPNPAFDGTTTVFYASHLSYGCAAWSVKTALAFSDAFFNELDVVPPYDGDRGHFETA